ncbi:hypothetical protein BB558_001068 [Smittium angustum]|uniref:Uncharacterized protein n=1 Tax=Smittium angustum TaxID=133377 RepID=A0A2U1JCQ5_SMIAN|nr:hypothetical protein BB558_001068 [Smittium angustum]
MWLRRQTRNLLGSARTGSNPVADEYAWLAQSVERETLNLKWLRRQTRNLLGSARTGSNPVADEYAWLAQSVERETLNLKVAGSTPALG